MYKSNKIHKTSSFGTGKRDFFIHQTKTETYNLCHPPFHEPGSGSSLKFSKYTFYRPLLTIFLSPQGKGMDWMEENGLQGNAEKVTHKIFKMLGKGREMENR
jgi:hypothetical protein